MIKQTHSLTQILHEIQLIGGRITASAKFCSSISHPSAFQIKPLGNLTSTRSRSHHRRPPMATAAAAAASASAAGNPSPTSSNPFVFSPDSPPTLALTPDQVKFCSEALDVFREKLQTPHVINQEFARLQVRLPFLIP